LNIERVVQHANILLKQLSKIHRFVLPNFTKRNSFQFSDWGYFHLRAFFLVVRTLGYLGGPFRPPDYPLFV